MALSQVFTDAHPVWQNDLVNHQVRARHWPDALQIVQDVRTVNPNDLPRIDLLTAGFPCQDLSTANKRKDKGGLDGKRSGLYREVLRFSQTIRPQFVLMENVSALLPLLGRLSADFQEIGYGLTWTVCEALDAGLPHHRRRVFVLAELDTNGRGLVDVDQSAQWKHETLRTWLTATATDHKTPAGFIRTNHPPQGSESNCSLSKADESIQTGWNCSWDTIWGGQIQTEQMNSRTNYLIQSKAGIRLITIVLFVGPASIGNLNGLCRTDQSLRDG